MTTIWTYPWTFAPDTIDDELDALQDAGVTGLTVAGHYHSIQTLLPRCDAHGIFDSYPGGCHFDPDATYFEDTAIEPPVNDSSPDGERDAFGMVATAAGGLEVNAWTVCLHNSRLGATNPQFRIQSAFGGTHDHSLCPSWPAVRAYYEGIVKSLCDYDISRIDLESIGFPDVFHGHGDEFGHQKNHVIDSDAGHFLLSQCFCDGCGAAATDHPVDLKGARTVVQYLLKETFRGSVSTLPSIDDLLNHYDELQSLLSFRTAVIERLVRRLDAASSDVPLHYYLADGFGYLPATVEPAGVDLERLDSVLDSITVICYTDDPDVARDRIQRARTVFDGPVHAGVTLDPDVVQTEDEFLTVAKTAQEAATGDLAIYNYSLLGDERAQWLRTVA
jgi:hypothetical protein